MYNTIWAYYVTPSFGLYVGYSSEVLQPSNLLKLLNSTTSSKAKWLLYAPPNASHFPYLLVQVPNVVGVVVGLCGFLCADDDGFGGW